MPTRISGAIAGEGIGEKNLVGPDHDHMHVMVAIVYATNSACFLAIVDENMIVYD